jgi:prolipoprotein diacylglyceryltransferase
MSNDPSTATRSTGRNLILWGVVLFVVGALIWFITTSASNAEAASPIVEITALIVALGGLITALTGLVKALKSKGDPIEAE